MFAGRYDHALDSKGRTMMPKRFRARLADLSDRSVWITNALDGSDHLEVRPDSSFQAFFEKVSALGNKKALLDFRRYYFGAAIEVEIDAAGRILVPASFRQKLGLGDRITFLGVDRERFELWQPEVLDERFAQVSENPEALLDELSELGL